ncbi:allergen Tha p 1-like [Epargyreus clarus]|uniref:allergen Tha p 1-like n=1 Tax=Epargyreus clarus TaxID=520877 RepID=UPI003C2D3A90
MKTVVCLFVLMALAVAEPKEQYTSRFDGIDIGEILANKKLLHAYLKCILDKGRCTAEGRELKSHIREALENRCAKCTDTQRKGTRRVITHLINNEPDYWNQLTAKYDPTHQFTKQYETELRTVKA